jgi:ArsR family transcriptional regulator
MTGVHEHIHGDMSGGYARAGGDLMTTPRSGVERPGEQIDLAPPEVHSAERSAAPPAPARRPATLAAAGELLRALAAPVRIAIVLQLRESERCVHELVDALGVTQPLISQHLRVLKAAGVVSGERHGREVVYRLVDEHLAHIVIDAVTHVEEGT